jgi:hypothetical protein
VAQAVPAQPRQAQAQQGGPPLVSPPTGPPELTDELNNGADALLFGPSDRPDEPVTHGAPFGPGASFTAEPDETQRSFLLRVADSLDASPAATAQARRYITRIRLGE